MSSLKITCTPIAIEANAAQNPMIRNSKGLHDEGDQEDSSRV
jgi:hypothetical protein